MVRLEEIDESNWLMNLKVAESQREYVANSTVILARAYAYRNARSRTFLICDDEIPVGMGLYYDCEDLDAYNFSELFIDCRYQGRGYGKAAAALVLEEMRRDGKYGKVVLCYIEGNETARRLYEGFGFQEVDRDDDEIIMELKLPH